MTEYSNAFSNRMLVTDRLRDGTGAWDDMNINNSCCYLLENEILKNVVMNKKKTGGVTPLFDLRALRGTYISQGSYDIPSKKLVC